MSAPDLQLPTLNEVASSALSQWHRFMRPLRIPGIRRNDLVPHALALRVENMAEVMPHLLSYMGADGELYLGSNGSRQIATIRRKRAIANTTIRELTIIERHPDRQEPLGLIRLEVRLAPELELGAIQEELRGQGVSCSLNDGFLICRNGCEFWLTHTSPWTRRLVTVVSGILSP
jgi:hypothetical protein